jgi:phospholipid/cholesterol/gamma-HCH transport system substrate-binding protein
LAVRRHEIGVGLLLVVAMLVTGFMALKVGAIGSFTPQIQVDVLIADASGVGPGSSVSVAGVDIGQVDSLTIAHDQARVRLLLNEDAAIRADAEVRVRSRSVLGEKYIELTPKSLDAAVLVDGGTLYEAPGRTEIDELVNTMGSLLAGIEPEVLDEVTGSIRDTLAEDPQRLSRMLQNADKALTNIAQATDDLGPLVSEGRATMGAARTAVETLNRRAQEARPLLAKADELLSDLGDATAEVPAAVDDARTTLAEARKAMELVNASADDLQEILGNLSAFDRDELRRLMREEGILVRIRPKRITNDQE